MNTNKFRSEYDKALREASSDEPDLQLVKKLLENATQRGDPRAMYALGSWYLHGNALVNVDQEMAFQFLWQAAQEGHGDACHDIAYAYETGVFLEQSYDAALLWYFVAGFCGDNSSVFEAARILHHELSKLENIRIDLIERMFLLSEIFGVYEE